ncbi:MYB103 protein [Hibiscus syriacus]|uniref:MYB103 protein n=1 Tax=Hibiscus syriacus TaxID=106335 RepID=A0A6A2XYU8_HIBSY|nr:MYB103 protein [Hibiscus syriacus]
MSVAVARKDSGGGLKLRFGVVLCKLSSPYLFPDFLGKDIELGIVVLDALKSCTVSRNLELGSCIHAAVLKSWLQTDVFVNNSLLDMYMKCGCVEYARELFDHMPDRTVASWTAMISEAVKLLERFRSRDVVSWTSIISGSVLHGSMHEALLVFFRMQEDGVAPNEVTIMSILRALETYLTNGYFTEGIQLFSGFCFDGEGRYLTPETIASLLQYCGHFNHLKLGKQLHGYLIKHGFSSSIIQNSLINICLIKNDEFHEALNLLKDIHCNGGEMRPDFITMLTLIQACSNLSFIMPGQVIHGYITKAGLICDIFIQNALIDMYGRSGKLDLAEEIFAGLPSKDLDSWNSLIAAYGINGNGRLALQAFTKLNNSSPHRPNAITFTNILSACSHTRLVEEGYEIFKSMQKESGKLEEAEAFIKGMTLKPSNDAWYALLGACGFHGNVCIAERVAEKLSIQDPEGIVWRIALSNIYGYRGHWEDAERVRAQLRQLEGVKKGRWSTVEVDGKMCKFMVNDTRHPESKSIYAAVSMMVEHASECALNQL